VTKRAGGARPPEPEEPPASDIGWDEVVDVVCVSFAPGPTAQAISGAQRGLRALSVAQPQIWDADAAAYIAAMTVGLPAAATVPGPALTCARPVDDEPARGRVIDTFAGAQLRDWAELCWASAFGVLYTDVVGTGMTPMRTDDDVRIVASVVGYRSDADGSGRALADWLAAQAREHEVQPDPDVRLQRLIFEYGRVAGVELGTGSGPLLVRALDGVALPTAPLDAVPPDAVPSDAGRSVRPAPGEVAIVGRPASRFGRVDLLIPDPLRAG
jgi:hypothetical protein